MPGPRDWVAPIGCKLPTPELCFELIWIRVCTSYCCPLLWLNRRKETKTAKLCLCHSHRQCLCSVLIASEWKIGWFQTKPSLIPNKTFVDSEQNLRWFRTKLLLVPNKTFVGSEQNFCWFQTKPSLAPNKTFVGSEQNRRWFRTKLLLVANKTFVGSEQNIRWFRTKPSLVPNKTFVGSEQNFRWFQTRPLLVSNKTFERRNGQLLLMTRSLSLRCLISLQSSAPQVNTIAIDR